MAWRTSKRHVVAAPCAWLVLACSVLQVGPAGSPSGGSYCFQEPGKTDACYPSESERAAGQSARQEAIRADETRKAQAAAALPAGEEPGLQRAARLERERRQAEVAERDRVFAERHAAEDAKKQADSERAAELHTKAQDPAYAVPAISAIMCSIQDEITGLRADLAHEKRVTAIGGVVNLSARDEAANDIVDDTDELKTWGQALKRFSATQLPCKQVAPIVACRHKVETCDDASRGPCRGLGQGAGDPLGLGQRAAEPLMDKSQANDSPLWARLVTVALVAGICFLFYRHYRRPEKGEVEAQVAADAVEQYSDAKRSGDAIAVCSKADIVAAAFLRASDQPQYAAWKAIEEADCARAGVPMPP